MREFKFSFTQNSFIRYLLIGLLSNALNFSSYVLIFLIFENIILSSVMGYLLGLSTSFYFGKMWVFKSYQVFRFSEIIKFLAIYLVGGLGMTLIIIYLNQSLDLGYKLSWIGGAIFAIINNYFGSKYIAFNNK